ncbi:MAG: LLM class F420-dependent oxidoreductase [Alphaproteobacteria bacterium]|nr:LLM class F420-dependent oxidoreductase [Alphaproteobacteria bacterium]
MRIGVVFPTSEIGNDPAAIRDFAQAAECAGFAHLVAYDHVLGANAESEHGRRARYKHTHAFHEPFVLFGFVAAVTTRIELFTGIIVLPQRQTVLAAKQAAEIDVLSGSRLRLGIAVGPNAFEYEGLGENFGNRGQRIEEQIDLMRRLWREPLLTYRGRWHSVSDAGINPLPLKRTIPIWNGGRADAVLERTARLCDGWYCLIEPGDEARAAIRKLRVYVRAAGRDEGAVGIEARIPIAGRTPEACVEDAMWWIEAGATHLSFHTMEAGFERPMEHIAAIGSFMRALRPFVAGAGVAYRSGSAPQLAVDARSAGIDPGRIP